MCCWQCFNVKWIFAVGLQTASALTEYRCLVKLANTAHWLCVHLCSSAWNQTDFKSYQAVSSCFCFPVVSLLFTLFSIIWSILLNLQQWETVPKPFSVWGGQSCVISNWKHKILACNAKYLKLSKHCHMLSDRQTLSPRNYVYIIWVDFREVLYFCAAYKVQDIDTRDWGLCPEPCMWLDLGDRSTLAKIRQRLWLWLNLNILNTSYLMLQVTFVFYGIKPRPWSFSN